ncbi:MAG TPA: SDR family NAD(P)-dependent oxidoreductase [Arenimonas sp.]|nr:SDR family NAD(P)-dependent oxidoreductase [Arenimonas sp.]
MGRFWIITGASRGLGAALARAAVASGGAVLGLARQPSAAGESLCVDLGDPQAAADALAAALQARALGDFAQLLLVNNAAVLGPVGSDYTVAEAARHYTINVLAPIALGQAFIAATAGLAARRRILNISSGAASRPFAGWNLYCSSKAALEMHGRCLALEQQTAACPVEVVAISPGVIDTGMQAQIRSCDAAVFPDVARFLALHQEGALQAPEAVASALLAGSASSRRFAGETLTLAEWAASD